MCCQYRNGVIITGKCYPNNEDAYITRYRQTLQLILSTIENVPNLWTFSRNTHKIQTFVTTASNSAHYRDYEYSGQKPTISLGKGFGIDLDDTMKIGHEAYCVHCGIELDGDDSGYLSCRRHRKKPICAHCGRLIIDEDDRIEIDDEIYCRDCTFYCDHHHRYELIERGSNEIKLAGGLCITVCNNALSCYRQCSTCGVWHKINDGHFGNEGFHCDACYKKLKADGKWHVKFEVVGYSDYQVGDYVLIVDNVNVCTYTATPEMRRYYPNRIARITYIGGICNKTYELTIDPDCYDGWNWSSNCFVGKIVGDVSDNILGKTLEEIM
jgi:hypothetical protein